MGEEENRRKNNKAKKIFMVDVKMSINWLSK